MMMNLVGAMSEGRTFPLTLRFERAGTLEIEVTAHADKPMGMAGDKRHGSANEHGSHRKGSADMKHGSGHGHSN